ncbi:retrotransposon protein, putative, ty1-copia subclass [Tanacetum coccineum]
MHNMGKTISELHALLIEYEKGLHKKAATPQVMAIQGGRIQKANKNRLMLKARDDACHHCKEVGHCKRNCPAYLVELIKKKKQVGTTSSSAKYNLDSTYLWHCRLAHISKKRIEKLQHDGLLKSTDEESFDQCVSCLSGKMTRKPFLHHTEKATDLLRLIHTDVCGPLRHVSRQGEYISQEFKDYLKAYGIVQQLTPLYTPQHNGVSERRNRTLLDMARSMMNLTTLPLSFWDYALETATRILNIVPTKKGCEALVKRDTLEKLQQRSVKCIFIGYPKEMLEVSGRTVELEEIQDEDTSPSENISEIPIEVEGFEPPQEEVIPIRRSVRTHEAPKRLCLNVEVEEHSLGDLNEPTNYKAALLDPESDKWVDAMNAEMQFMKDNQVWCLVDLPPKILLEVNGF